MAGLSIVESLVLVAALGVGGGLALARFFPQVIGLQKKP